MKLLLDIMGVLAFRSRALRALAARNALLIAFLILCFGLVIFGLVRNSVYADLGEPSAALGHQAGLLRSIFDLNLLHTVLFVSLVYIPAVICLSNAFAGDGLGFSFARGEYYAHVTTLLPLWGTLLLITAPLQWLVPRFLVLSFFEISVGLLTLVALMTVYTVWSIKELNYISLTAALGVFVVSWFTLPIFYLLTMFVFALPLFFMIPIIYLLVQRIRMVVSARTAERGFREHLHTLTINPQDADAHHQLGLVHLKRGNLDAAQRYFEDALRIEARDPDYHYFLGRVFEERGDWQSALEQYEETYRLSANYGLGDIFREVGKGYLHTGQVEKSVEFLQFFLQKRTSDPEGRYWLAVAFQKLGRRDEMRVQLNTVLDQARSNPRFFRKENRQWIYRSRVILRQIAS